MTPPRRPVHELDSSKKRKTVASTSNCQSPLSPPSVTEDPASAPSALGECFDRQRFLTRAKQQRYINLERRTFLCERRVELYGDEYEAFQHKLRQLKWSILASPAKQFNEEIVREFYANALQEDDHNRISHVRGQFISYDRIAIDTYLRIGFVLPEDGRDGYQNLLQQAYVSLEDIVAPLCIANHTYEVGKTGRARKILRSSMKTVTQIWVNFLLANVTLNTHISDINMDKAKLIYCILSNIPVDIAGIISDEIRKFVLSAPSSRGVAKPLGFPGLIHGLCRANGVQIPNHPLRSLRLPITASYIKAHCTNALDDVQGPASRPVSPPRGAPASNTIFSSLQDLMVRQFEHLCAQNAAHHRAYTSLNDSFHQLCLQQQQHPFEHFPWISPLQFQQLVAWPGDSPNWQGKMGVNGGTIEEEGEDN